MNNKTDLKKYIGMGIFSALAFVVALVCNIIPPVAGFLSLDAKDSVIAIASFVYGPVSAVVISFIAAFIEFITFSTTGWYGFVMNFASSAVFSLTASLIYKRLRSLNGALIAFFAAVIATTGVMLLLNRFVTPIYLFDYLGAMPEQVAKDYVISILPTVLLPFNFAKSLLNSSIAMLLYKPAVSALRKTGIAKGNAKMEFNKSSVIIISVGAVALISALVILLIIW
ncbi:MAG: ECF transporter S component [Clostridia bacterium]|nr:ECF transporter S component [Clostridia bacterium]